MVDRIKIPTSEIDECYSYGRCMFLATALHRKFGLEIQCVMESDSNGEFISHAWVVENGMIIDINGKNTPEMNDYVEDSSTIITGLSEQLLISVIHRYRQVNPHDWEIRVNEAMLIVNEYFS